MHHIDHPSTKRATGTAHPPGQIFAASRHHVASGLTASAIAVALLFAAPAWAGGNGGEGATPGGAAGAPGNLTTGAGGTGGAGPGIGAGGSGGGVGLASTADVTNPGGATIAGAIGGSGGAGALGTGGGGGGGDGLVVTTSAVTTNVGTIQGGNGGTPGVSASVPAGGAGGGGAGLITSGNVTNHGTIAGGAGGATAENSGSGGGGVGVLANGVTIFNDAGGAISGGAGGVSATVTFLAVAGDGGAGAGGAAGGELNNPGGGANAVGIKGGNLTVINKGTISGAGQTLYVPGANAITFTAGTNRLELHPGFSFVGNVVADGDDVLALGSEAPDNGTISLPILVPPAYTGFSQYEKTGPGIWTVTGAQVGTAGWKVVGGKLNVAAGATLGGVTLAGGILTGNGTVAQLIGGPGSVAPGNSVGTLTVTGSTTLAGATYAAEIDPAGSSADLLTVNGANLAGGTLTVTSLGGPPAVGQAFTVMSGTGITGTFGSVVYADTFPGVTPSVQYTPTSVQVVYAATVVVPPLAAVAVPTLSQWALALLALAVGGLAWRAQRTPRPRG